MSFTGLAGPCRLGLAGEGLLVWGEHGRSETHLEVKSQSFIASILAGQSFRNFAVSMPC